MVVVVIYRYLSHGWDVWIYIYINNFRHTVEKIKIWNVLQNTRSELGKKTMPGGFDGCGSDPWGYSPEHVMLQDRRIVQM